eukprot:2555-Heterococcus_DN1.PRE.2
MSAPAIPLLYMLPVSHKHQAGAHAHAGIYSSSTTKYACIHQLHKQLKAVNDHTQHNYLGCLSTACAHLDSERLLCMSVDDPQTYAAQPEISWFKAMH